MRDSSDSQKPEDAQHRAMANPSPQEKDIGGMRRTRPSRTPRKIQPLTPGEATVTPSSLPVAPGELAHLAHPTLNPSADDLVPALVFFMLLLHC